MARTFCRRRWFRCERLDDRLVPAVVTTHLDNGDNVSPTPGSLRAAVIDVLNSSGGSITFNLPQAVPIVVAAPGLPAIPFPVTIDGTSQPGYLPGKPAIEISGISAGLSTGFSLTGGNSSVSGLVINGFYYDGLYLSGSNYTITDNFIGTDVTGTSKVANDKGITIDLAENCTIVRNVIAGNANGQLRIDGIATNNNVVKGNFIGTDAAGVALISSFGDGIYVSGSGNIIGGPMPADANVVAGCSASGIHVVGDANTVENNRVGTDATGSAALVNGLYGIDVGGNTNTLRANVASNVHIVGGGNKLLGNLVGINAAGTAGLGGTGVEIVGAGNIVGGTAAADRNIISGNTGGGLSIHDDMTGGNIVQGNYIGLDATGTIAVGNGGNGVTLHATANNKIGGPGAGEGNVISANGSIGLVLDFIDVPAAFANTIEGNIIGLNAAGTAALGNKGDGVLLLTVKNHTITNNTISGNLGDGIKLGFNFGFGSHKVLNNKIGTDATGAIAFGNGLNGVEIIGSNANLVSGNVISANGKYGVAIQAAGPPTGSNTIQLNMIGTNAAGTADRGNVGAGIAILGSVSNLLGGPASLGNLISGNGGAGISIIDAAAANTIQGNTIGLNTAGTAKLANDGAGIELLGTSKSHLIGGTSGPQVNLIAGNGQAGIQIGPGSGGSHLIQGNTIGTNLANKTGIGNVGAGVSINKSTGNTVGGTATSMRNQISGNGGSGVSITDANSVNTIQNNVIGTTSDGQGALANDVSGIELLGITVNQLIGGSLATTNIISANGAYGILIGPASGANKIHGNVIGSDPSGSLGLGNGLDGIAIQGSSDNLIGTAERNLISNNGGAGIRVTALGAGNLIQNNRIGTDAGGNAAKGNVGSGVVYNGAGPNNLGGTGAGNVISGNASDGVEIIGSDSITIQDNTIGLGLDGTTDVGNTSHGVSVTNAKAAKLLDNVISGNGLFGVYIFNNAKNTGADTITGNKVGADKSGTADKGNDSGGVIIDKASGNSVSGNVISGNGGSGLSLSGSDTNTIQGNRIGTSFDGTGDLHNDGHGILITGSAAKNTIGGATTAEGNTISFNGTPSGAKAHGVEVQSGTGNTISHNSIHSNTGRGIDLGDDWVTINSPNGDDALQDYPVVVMRPEGPADVGDHVWKLNSTPNRTFTVEFFANPSLDPAEYGEGREFLSAVAVPIGGSGDATFTFNHTGHEFITATATDTTTGSTSEFSLIDTDVDGLCDVWEMADGLDFDEDGNLTANEKILPGSNRLHKDVYVEVDAMTGFAPGAANFDPMVNTSVPAAFAKALDSNVHNPDQMDGVTLHVVYDQKNLPVVDFTTVDDPFADFRPVKNGTQADHKDGSFGTALQHNDPNWADIRQALTLTHRYCIFAQQWRFFQRDAMGNQVMDAGGNPIVIASSSGAAYIGGNELMVTFGDPSWGTMTPALNDTDRAGTFMHELGHTLGLNHGGDPSDGHNDKPNYKSVMNYTWQFPDAKNRFTVRTAPYGPWALDYSSVKLGDLNESALDETAGLVSADAFTVTYGRPGKIGVASAGPASTVDWNFKNGVEGGTVSTDINFSGGKSTLRGHNDWLNLQYSFLESPFFSAGTTPPVDHAESPPGSFFPTVASVTVNDDSAQRSRVTSVTVTFDSLVTLPTNPADAFQLQRQSDGALVGLSASVTGSTATSVVLTFTGTTAVEAASLADGRYTLTVVANQVTNTWGLLDGDADGYSGGNFVLACDAAPNPPTNIFRKFGDNDGDGDADAADFGALRLAFGTTSNLAFDSDGDGDVDASDYGQFRVRFGSSV